MVQTAQIHCLKATRHYFDTPLILLMNYDLLKQIKPTQCQQLLLQHDFDWCKLHILQVHQDFVWVTVGLPIEHLQLP